MPAPYQTTYRAHIETNGTVPLAAESCYIAGVIISISALGTSWSVSVVDTATPPMAIVPPTLLSATNPPENPWVIDLTHARAFMLNAVNVVTSGTTPGTLDVWVVATDQPTSY